MRLLLKTTLLACALAAPALAEDTVVPVEKAPYHRPVFHNDLVMLLSVYLPPGAPRGPEVYHTHSLDQISVLAQAADMTNQALGEPAMGPARRGQRGNVGSPPFPRSRRPTAAPMSAARRFTTSSSDCFIRSPAASRRVRAPRLRATSSSSTMTECAPGA